MSTCPSIIYDIIIIESIAESGNFNGNFVVSISNAITTGSGLCKRSVLSVISTCVTPRTLTVYQCPYY